MAPERIRTTKLNSPYIRQLMGGKGMSAQGLAWKLGIWEGRLKKHLEEETVDVAFAAQVAQALGVPIVEITRTG